MTFQECLVCVAEFWISLVEKWPIRSLMPTRVENGGYGQDRLSAEVIFNIIGATLLVLDVQMKLLQICGPLLMVIVLQLPLCLYELKGFHEVELEPPSGQWSVWMKISFPKM